jgi:alkylation response protein AidB-like acyl-CoA dehydrogenase
MSASTDPAVLAGYRQEVREWLRDNVSSLEGNSAQELTDERVSELRSTQKRLYGAGYAGFTFAKSLGGQGLTLDHEAVFLEEASGYQVASQLFGVSINILGATLAAYGTEAQQKAHIPRILSGEEIWLQLLSEPSGGSDLAGLLTSAKRDNDTYILNGQKTWSSLGHLADYGLCPARTRSDVAKHAGISVFIVPLDAPGVEVRRIRKITGDDEFCEVFLTDVAIPAENLVGEENEGWRVLKGLLEIEHAWVGRVGGRGDLMDAFHTLTALARNRGIEAEPTVRRQLAALFVAVSAQKALAQRVAEGTASGELPRGYGSLLKLGDSPLRQRIAEAGLHMGGADGVAWRPGSASARYAQNYLDSRSATIAGGTTEIQRNNVAERVLGLPKDPSPFANAPFNEIPHN